MKKREFINIEKRFLDFVISLWLYNETYVDICSSEFNSSYYYKKNKKLLKKHSKFFTKSAENDEFLLIENKDILHSFAILATREISPVIFYFRDSKIMLLLNGCIGLIYYGLPKEDLLTKQIADNCSLYLY